MRKNIWIKISSVVLAVVLWFFVILRGYSDVSIIAPVEFENVPAGLYVVASESTSSVAIELRGHERLIKNFSEGSTNVKLDVKGLSKGRHRLNVDKKDINVPLFVRVISVKPPSVEVVLEGGVTRSVPVKPYVVGQPEKGYNVVRMKVVPGSVDVEGGGSEVEKLQWLKTEAVDISGATGTVERKVSVAGPEGLSIKGGAVTVEIVIEKEKRR